MARFRRVECSMEAHACIVTSLSVGTAFTVQFIPLPTLEVPHGTLTVFAVKQSLLTCICQTL